ncbi:hypothetical protein J7K86_00255, partial [bacterium]|nr:hypothetical protein [bacterium]
VKNFVFARVVVVSLREKSCCWYLYKGTRQGVSLYNEVIVLYSEGCEKNLKGIWEITSDKKENGIRTIRIRHRRPPIPKTTYFIYLFSIFKCFGKLLNESWKSDIIHAHVYSAGFQQLF